MYLLDDAGVIQYVRYCRIGRGRVALDCKVHRLVLRAGVIPDTEVIFDVKQVHTCEKPIPLLQRLISTFSREGDVIFDGFVQFGSSPSHKYKIIGVLLVRIFTSFRRVR